MHRPLFGTSVLITRPVEQSTELSSQLAELGTEVLFQPAIRIEPLDDFTELDLVIQTISTNESSPAYHWLIFSSRNGVVHFFRRLHELGFDARILARTKLAAVGPGTASALSECQFICDCVPDEAFGAESLAKQLIDKIQNQRCLIVRGSRSRETLERELANPSIGALVRSVIAYQNVDEPNFAVDIVTRMQQGRIDFTTVTSSSIARSLAANFGEALHKTKLISISPLTTQTLLELGFTPFQEATETTICELLPQWKT